MNTIKITPENVIEYGPGTKVRIFSGAYFPVYDWIVTRLEIVPATKWFPASARLWAERVDPEEGVGETIIASFTDVGIGARLIKAVPAKKNTNSKWAGLDS